MLNILHSASKGHQSKTCTPYEFRGFDFETQGTGAPSVRSPLNGKIKYKKYSKLKQKIKNHNKGKRDQRPKNKGKNIEKLATVLATPWSKKGQRPKNVKEPISNILLIKC